jgi:phosphoglycolate phosphatase
VSNKTGRLLRREADQLGWTRHFDVIVGAGDAETDKPTTAPVDLALSGSGIPRGRQVWFVGDTAIDMECAAAAGCVGVLLSPGPADEGEFTRYRPELSYEHCRSFGQAFAAM